MSNVINAQNPLWHNIRVPVRNWFTDQLKAEGVGYLRLYSTKAKKHPKAVLGYRMKFYRLKRAEHKNVPLTTRIDMVNSRAQAIGLPYRLELEKVLTGYARPIANARIVPVSDCTVD